MYTSPMSVDRLPDMMRTAVNVTGDAAITTIVAKAENKISMETFNDLDADQVEEIHLPHEASLPEK